MPQGSLGHISKPWPKGLWGSPDDSISLSLQPARSRGWRREYVTYMQDVYFAVFRWLGYSAPFLEPRLQVPAAELFLSECLGFFSRLARFSSEVLRFSSA